MWFWFVSIDVEVPGGFGECYDNVFEGGIDLNLTAET